MTSDRERPEPEVVRDGAGAGQGSQPDGRGRRSAPAAADRLTDGRTKEWRNAWAMTERVPPADSAPGAAPGAPADSAPGTAPGAGERDAAGRQHTAALRETTGPERTSGPERTTSPERTSGPEVVAGPNVPGPEQLRDLVCAARVVLFGFEGPLCRLFTPGRARQVAAAMAAWVTGSGLRDIGAVLDAGGPTAADPHHLLAEVATRFPGSDLAAELADVLARAELAAVPAAWPTPFTDPLVRTWAAVGTRLAVTTATSTAAVHAYLARRGLTACFAPHVHGRTPSHGAAFAASRLHRILNATGTPPSAALVIGSTPAALGTARTAGVPFLGYASGAPATHALRAAGATVVDSMEKVLEAVRAPRG